MGAGVPRLGASGSALLAQKRMIVCEGAVILSIVQEGKCRPGMLGLSGSSPHYCRNQANVLRERLETQGSGSHGGRESIVLQAKAPLRRLFPESGCWSKLVLPSGVRAGTSGCQKPDIDGTCFHSVSGVSFLTRLSSSQPRRVSGRGGSCWETDDGGRGKGGGTTRRDSTRRGPRKKQEGRPGKHQGLPRQKKKIKKNKPFRPGWRGDGKERRRRRRACASAGSVSTRHRVTRAETRRAELSRAALGSAGRPRWAHPDLMGTDHMGPHVLDEVRIPRVGSAARPRDRRQSLPHGVGAGAGGGRGGRGGRSGRRGGRGARERGSAAASHAQARRLAVTSCRAAGGESHSRTTPAPCRPARGPLGGGLGCETKIGVLRQPETQISR